MTIIPYVFLILLGSLAEAKTFRNAYISFEMADSWKCNLEQTEWVCRSEQAQSSKEAIIVLTAKEVGPTDAISLYEAHLNSPISAPTKGGGITTSKVIYKAKSVKINNQAWIDSLHLGSEIPAYYTRYVATIKDKIAILVTFSAHKNFYQKYSADFFNAINSLRVIAGGNISQQPSFNHPGGAPGPFISPGPTGLPWQGEPIPDPQKSNSKKSLYGGIAFILAAIGIYIFLKSKNKI